MKSITRFLLLAVLLGIAMGTAHKLKHKLGHKNAMKVAPTDGEDSPLGAGPIYAKGWFKYFYSTESMNPTPNNFLINEKFKQQFDAYGPAKITPKQVKKKDKSGMYINIPDELHFFFYLDAQAIYVTNSRKDSVNHTYDSVLISNLDAQVPGSQDVGGVVDLGNFQEGFCFRLSGVSTTTGKFVWNICADTLQDKDNWMTKLKYMKSQQQDGTYTEGHANAAGTTSAVLTDPAYDPEYQKDLTSGMQSGGLLDTDQGGKRDGRWVLMQDWSSCSLACGGGTQTLQRVCVPPVGGGKPCSGDAVMTRDCNTQPCPAAASATVEDPEKVLPTKIEMRRISSQYQYYEDCKIKSGDLEIELKGMPQFQIPPKLPTRTILNNATLSVFKGDNFESIEYSIELNEIQSISDPDHDSIRCFKINGPSEEKSATLCAMAGEPYPLEQIKKEWTDAINHFKRDCQMAPRHYDPAAEAEFRKGMSQVENDILERKADAEDDKFALNEQEEIDNGVQNAAAVALQAVQKELQLEQMAEQAQELKNKRKDDDTNKNLDDARRKQQCIEKALRKRSREKETARREKEAADQVETIKAQAKQQILVQRSQQKARMDSLQKESDRKRDQTMKKIDEIRTAMTKQMVDAEKKGDAKLCASKDQKEIDSYCDSHYNEDFNENKSCKGQNDFCVMCCDSEFGDMASKDKDECKAQCKPVPEEMEEEGGSWVWVPDSNSV